MKKLGKKEMKRIKGGGGDGPCYLTGCVVPFPVCANGGTPQLDTVCTINPPRAIFICCPPVGD
jgi:hypothetical protein